MDAERWLPSVSLGNSEKICVMCMCHAAECVCSLPVPTHTHVHMHPYILTHTHLYLSEGTWHEVGLTPTVHMKRS